MNIGFVLSGGLERLTGGTLYDRLVVDELRRLGHRVEVITFAASGYGQRLVHAASPRLASLLGADGYDLILQDEVDHPALWLQNRWFKRRRPAVPIVSIVHALACHAGGSIAGTRIARTFERHYLRTLDGMVCISRRTRAQALAIAGRSLPVQIAYPAGDRLGQPEMTTDAISHRAHTQPFSILYLGNVTRAKQLGAVLACLSDPALAEARLTAIGSLTMDATYAREVQDLVARRDLGRRVTLCGVIADPAIIGEHLARSHVLVLPSVAEGLPLACLEAAAFAVPAIITAESAAGEIFSHQEDSLLVAPGDRRMLLHHLIELSSDRDRLARMSVATRARFKAHPTWSQTAAAIATFLETSCTSVAGGL